MTVAIAASLITGAATASSDQQIDRKIRAKYRHATLWGLRTAPEIEVEEAMIRVRRGDALLVDARTEEEREVSIIPGAITTAELSSALEARPRAMVVVYCTIGARSATTTRHLVRRGIEARNLVGGVLAWANAGGTFEHDGESTTRVHVHGPSWNLLPDGYDAVW